MTFPSAIIEEAVSAFKNLPGIGRKTALRLVLHLLQKDQESLDAFADSIKRLGTDLQYCKRCHNIAEGDLCNLCADKQRDQSLVCVVENLRELIAIENTGQYRGVYHILGGVISPVEGIGPESLNIDSLIQRVKNEPVKELIMALNPTMEGDTTIFYISRQLENTGIKITTLARGVAFGGDLEYVDDLTLARSLATRLPYDKYLSGKP